VENPFGSGAKGVRPIRLRIAGSDTGKGLRRRHRRRREGLGAP
jgi:hypothetical protein